MASRVMKRRKKAARARAQKDRVQPYQAKTVTPPNRLKTIANPRPAKRRHDLSIQSALAKPSKRVISHREAQGTTPPRKRREQTIPHVVAAQIKLRADANKTTRPAKPRDRSDDATASSSRRMCKERPNDVRKKGGGSKSYVPWCKYT
jgi:hypothetical protein